MLEGFVANLLDKRRHLNIVDMFQVVMKVPNILNVDLGPSSVSFVSVFEADRLGEEHASGLGDLSVVSHPVPSVTAHVSYSLREETNRDLLSTVSVVATLVPIIDALDHVVEVMFAGLYEESKVARLQDFWQGSDPSDWSMLVDPIINSRVRSMKWKAKANDSGVEMRRDLQINKSIFAQFTVKA